jgi:ketosteroid isomerase-like protein
MHLRKIYLPVVAAVLLAGATAASTAAQSASRQPSAQAVATRYFQILDAGMKSGNFAALASVFAPDATLTRSTPKGVTTVYHGLAAITRFYQTLPKSAPGYQWTTDSMRTLVPTVVLAYEHAAPPSMAVPSRCAHVFLIQNGKIVSYDWIAFFPGKK